MKGRKLSSKVSEQLFFLKIADNGQTKTCFGETFGTGIFCLRSTPVSVDRVNTFDRIIME